MNRKKSLRAAAESTHTAADRRDAADRAVSAISDYAETFTPYLTEAQERIAPLAKQAQDTVQPLAKQAQDKLEPLAKQAQDKLQPLAKQAQGKLQPLAKQGSALAHDAYDAAAPALNDALGKVTPVVDSARDKVQSDLLPRLHDALDSAAGIGQEVTSRGKDVSKRSKKALKQAKKENAKLKGALGSATVASKAAGKGVQKAAGKQTEKKSGAKKTLTGIAIVSAIAAIAYLAFKKFFTDPAQSDPWKAYEPASPFAKPDSGAEGAEETADFPEEPAAETVDQLEPLDDPAVAGADPATTNAADPVDAAPVVGDTGNTAADATEEIPTVTPADSVGEEAAPVHADGIGSYTGEDPPEGFTIKGNERSMKYHTPDSGGYDRTIAEVWFSSEEAAQRAGFTKAQR